MSKISICIPAYEAQGKAVEMLEWSFGILENQNFNDFEVVLSDDSEDNEIKNLVSHWDEKLNLKYIKNKGAKGPSPNLNNAIANSSGEIIRVLCMDDYLLDEDSLQKIVDNFDYDRKWMVAAYFHTNDRKELFKLQVPKWNNRIYAVNTIGTHSSLSILNEDPLPFDSSLIYYMDCEYYQRLHSRYGLPKILEEPTFVQLLSPQQVSNTLVTEEVNSRELKYVLNKYEQGGSIFERVVKLS